MYQSNWTGLPASSSSCQGCRCPELKFGAEIDALRRSWHRPLFSTSGAAVTLPPVLRPHEVLDALTHSPFRAHLPSLPSHTRLPLC